MVRDFVTNNSRVSNYHMLLFCYTNTKPNFGAPTTAPLGGCPRHPLATPLPLNRPALFLYCVPCLDSGLAAMTSIAWVLLLLTAVSFQNSAWWVLEYTNPKMS